MHVLLFLFIGGIILTGGDILMKFWATSSNWYYYVAGLIVYLVGLMLFAETLKSENIAIASAILVMVNIVSLLIVGWLFFHEPYTHQKLIGILLALSAIGVLEFGS